MRAVTVVGLGLVATLACSSKNDKTIGAGGAGGGNGGGGGAGVAGAGGAGGSDAAAALTDAQAPADQPVSPPYAAETAPANVVFSDPPSMSCAGDAGACDFPPSSCADPQCADGDYYRCQPWAWLVYYDNPRCVAGACVWDRRYFKCEDSQRCVNGGCILNVTIVIIP